jgi:hypothetical protein
MQAVIRLAHAPHSHIAIHITLIIAGLLMIVHLAGPASNYVRLITAR